MNCPECDTEMIRHYDAPVQEYPGAACWSGSVYYECPSCGYETAIKDVPFPEDHIQENTRGW